VTFIVRLWRDEAGKLAGIVARVQTGEKARVETFDAIAGVIARMVAGAGDRLTTRDHEDRPCP
jgi:hypothetical protein